MSRATHRRDAFARYKTKQIKALWALAAELFGRQRPLSDEEYEVLSQVANETLQTTSIIPGMR